MPKLKSSRPHMLLNSWRHQRLMVNPNLFQRAASGPWWLLMEFSGGVWLLFPQPYAASRKETLELVPSVADGLQALISQSLSLHQTQPACSADSGPTRVSREISPVSAIIPVTGGELRGHKRLQGEAFHHGIPRTRWTQPFLYIPWGNCSVIC